MLLAGLFSGLARLNTPATRTFSHSLTFGIDLAVLSNILQYVYNKTKNNRADFQGCRKWGPFLCCFVALFACMGDLTRNLVNDAWSMVCTGLDRDKYPNAVIGIQYGTDDPFSPLDSKYTKYCYPMSIGSGHDPNGLFGLSVYGWVFTIFLTYFGFLMLFVGIFWAVSLPQKLMYQWKVIRGNRASRDPDGIRAPMAAPRQCS